MANNTKDLSRLVKSLNILGSEVDVSYSTALFHSDGDECLGLYHGGQNLIEISNADELPYDSQLSTLLHECIECIVDKLEINIDHRDISTLETSMFQLMRDNPSLCKAFSLYQPRSKKDGST